MGCKRTVKHGGKAERDGEHQLRQNAKNDTPPFLQVFTAATSQPTLAKHIPREYSKEDKVVIEDNILLLLISNNLPFSFVESESFRTVLGLFHAKPYIPCRTTVSGPVLDRMYDALVESFNKNVNGVCSIAWDGWTNTNGVGVYNHLCSTANHTFFVETTPFQPSPTAVDIAADVDRVITKHSDLQVYGVVSDNTKANGSAWTILERKYPHMFAYGCYPDALHLLCKDVFSPSKGACDLLGPEEGDVDYQINSNNNNATAATMNITSSNNDSSINNKDSKSEKRANKKRKNASPDETGSLQPVNARFINALEVCGKIVMSINNHHLVYQHYSNLENATRLHLPAPTRWGSALAMFRWMSENWDGVSITLFNHQSILDDKGLIGQVTPALRQQQLHHYLGTSCRLL